MTDLAKAKPFQHDIPMASSETKINQTPQQVRGDNIFALIVAGGSGARMQGALPKQYMELGGKTILRRTVETFMNHPAISGVRVVVRREDVPLYKKAVEDLTLCPCVVGGSSRQESVRRGLQSIAHHKPAKVLVHDAARPLASPALISRVVEALVAHDAVIPVLPIADTIRNITDAETHTVPRENLFSVQTPQGFCYAALLSAHEQFASEALTDDAALFEKLGKKLASVSGEASNFKITTPEDIKRFMDILSQQTEVRTGMGYDVHRLLPHQPETPVAKHVVRLCGVDIPHSHYLKGHSDADVGLHAIVDALLGAMSEGDIGSHFPPNDTKWKGADSSRFLLYAYELLRKKGGDIINLDLTIICEEPKIIPHRAAMVRHIAHLLKIEEHRVSIKATTTETLGFTGRKEGVAAQALANVRLPRNYSPHP